MSANSSHTASLSFLIFLPFLWSLSNCLSLLLFFIVHSECSSFNHTIQMDSFALKWSNLDFITACWSCACLLSQWVACQRTVSILRTVWAARALIGWPYTSWRLMTSPSCRTFWRGWSSAAWPGPTTPKASSTTATLDRTAKLTVRARDPRQTTLLSSFTYITLSLFS